MKQTAYLIDCRKHESDFNKGFLNKGYAFISKTMPNIPCVWKASEFYDDMLNPRGILIAFSDNKERDESKRERMLNQICETAAKNDINEICRGELTDFPEGAAGGFTVHIKDDLCFIWNVNAAFSSDEISSEVGILVRGLSDMRYIKYISSKYNYLKLFFSDIEKAHTIADELIKYNGTAIQITDMLGELRSCRRIFVLDESYLDKMKYFHDKISVNFVFESHDALCTEVYTNKLGKIKLDASYLSFVCTYGHNQSKYVDLRAIENFLSQRVMI